MTGVERKFGRGGSFSKNGHDCGWRAADFASIQSEPQKPPSPWLNQLQPNLNSLRLYEDLARPWEQLGLIVHLLRARDRQTPGGARGALPLRPSRQVAPLRRAHWLAPLANGPHGRSL
jgi:hypothetical protein